MRAVLCGIALMLLPHLAWAADVDAILTTQINTVDAGEAQVVLRPGDILVPPSALKNTNYTAIPGVREIILGARTLVSLSSMAPAVTYRLDVEQLMLFITMDPHYLPGTTINLRSAPPADMEYHKDTTGFVNYALSLRDFEHLNGYFEGGLSIRGSFLYSSMNLSSDAWIPVRGQSNWSYDERTAMRRWIVGDTFASTGELGGGTFLAGLTVTRNFGADPYFVRYPMFAQTGLALLPSTVDVYLNGTLIRREALPPGPFTLRDVPASTGSGTIRYVLRDVLGATSEVNHQFYLSPGILAAGLHDYGYSVGFRRSNVATSSFDYHDPVLLIRHRMGITSWLTGGARLEVAPSLISGGATVTTRAPIGELSAAASGSFDDGASGVAGQVGWSYATRRFGTTLFAAFASDHYATVSTRSIDDRPTADVTASLSVPIVSRLTASVQGSFEVLRDHGPSTRVAGQVTAALGRRVGLLLNGSWAHTSDGSASWEVGTLLTIALGGTRSGSVGWTQRGTTGLGTLDLQQPLPRGVGYGYHAHANLGTQQQDALAGVSAQTAFGRYSAEYSYINGQHHTDIELAGSIVAVKGAGLFLSRPIQDGFALIRIPDVGGVRGYLNNQEVGRSDRRGNMLIPDLLPYYGNRLSINPVDIPINRTLERTEFTIAPPPRGGALVNVVAPDIHYLRGRVVVVHGIRRTMPAYGELTVHTPEGDRVSPLGLEGEFELEAVSAGRHRADVLWAGGQCAFQLTVPSSSATLIDLGQKRCAQESK